MVDSAHAAADELKARLVQAQCTASTATTAARSAEAEARKLESAANERQRILQ